MESVKIQKIRSVKPLGKCATIDLEVDHKDHNFYCEGFVTSNSHSISYAYLAAITVYLKFNYPQEFFLSLLKFARFEPNAHEEIAKISQELNLFDIRLLPPDLNRSELDFSKDGKDIRYGLNCIKGVSDKVMESLVEFREQSFSNKYEFFVSAKQSGLNIGTVSAFIQAGMLDSFVDKDRCRLVLEAQTFNILTIRERRHIIELGERFNYDVLDAIYHSHKEKIIGDDGKALFSDKRFETFKKNYTPYKNIYEQNKKHIKFANWFFETQLLGYSYSHTIRDVFKEEEQGRLSSTAEIKEVADRTPLKFVGSVLDVMKRVSRGGNKYARISLSDEVGNLDVLLIDTQNEQKLTNFITSGKKLPKKGDVAIIFGVKSNDSIFVNNIKILEDKIYMKLSEVK
jgi:DNA polymerase III subunit alpha